MGFLGGRSGANGLRLTIGCTSDTSDYTGRVELQPAESRPRPVPSLERG